MTQIVVLDDNPVANRLTKASLERIGYKVRTATNLTQLQALLVEAPAQLILTDVEMPEAAGDEICRVLRQQVETANVPIFLFSGLPEGELAERAERAGADGYICKEAGPEGLKAKLQQVLADVVF